jgi:hypothetical protein
MRLTLTTRHTAGIVAAAVALGTAGPAGARPFNENAAGSFVPAGPQQAMAQAATPAPGHAPDSGGISELGYIAIGTGGAAVVLIGIGGTRTASRRRQRTGAASRATTTA